MKKALLVAGAAALVVALAGCGAQSGSPTSGSTGINVRIANDLHTLDPHHAYSTDALFAVYFAYDTLLANVNGEIQPAIATDYEVSPTSIRLSIRDGIECSDGTEITPSTVAKNVERIVDPDNPARLATVIFGSLDVAASADDSAGTVEITTAKPYGDLLAGMTRVFVLCEAGLEKNEEELRRASFGTGAFELTESVSGDHYTFEARDGREDLTPALSAEKRPERVKMTLVENDSTAANLLLSGQLDLARIDGPDRERVESQEGIDLTVQTANSFALIFNEREGMPAHDEAVRRGLLSSVNQKELAQAAGGSFARPAETFLVEGAVCQTDDDRGVIAAFNPDLALSAFKEAGYKELDGKLMKDGSQLTVSLAIWDAQAPAVDYLMDTWGKAGVKVTGNAMPGNRLGEVLESGTGWDVSISNLRAYETTQNLIMFTGPPPPEGLNYGNIQNAMYDELSAAASQQITSEACELWSEANQALISEGNVLPIYWEDTAVYSKGLSFLGAPHLGYGIHPATISN